jgi:hypothetical protein
MLPGRIYRNARFLQVLQRLMGVENAIHPVCHLYIRHQRIETYSLIKRAMALKPDRCQYQIVNAEYINPQRQRPYRRECVSTRKSSGASTTAGARVLRMGRQPLRGFVDGGLRTVRLLAQLATFRPSVRPVTAHRALGRRTSHRRSRSWLKNEGVL